MTADAIATSCMVMGFEKAQFLINNMDDVSACFFIGATDGSIQTVYSNGFIQFVAQ
jgi:thiamine biosynthesis lipoprotein